MVPTFRHCCGLLTERVHESCATLLMAAVAFGDGADDWHAVIGRGRGRRRRVLVLRVAAGAVLAAGGRGAVGVRGAVAAAQLVHDPRLCHQLCAGTHKEHQTRSATTRDGISGYLCYFLSARH